MFPPEVRPPCGSSSALSLAEHGLWVRSAQTRQPTPKTVAIATHGFHQVASCSFKVPASRAEVCGHLGVPGHKQSSKCEEKKGHDGADHQLSYISFLPRVLQVDIHL
jgi:hypothetical protein